MKPHTPEPTPFECCGACGAIWQRGNDRPCDCDLGDAAFPYSR